MRYAFHRRPFLLIGLLTLCLFFLVAGLDRAGQSNAAQALAIPMRVLIVPVYLVWLLMSMALVAVFGPGGLPGPFGVVVSGVSFALALTPYFFADYVFHRWRQAAARKVAANDSSGPRSSPLDSSRDEKRS